MTGEIVERIETALELSLTTAIVIGVLVSFGIIIVGVIAL